MSSKTKSSSRLTKAKIAQLEIDIKSENYTIQQLMKKYEKSYNTIHDYYKKFGVLVPSKSKRLKKVESERQRVETETAELALTHEAASASLMVTLENYNTLESLVMKDRKMKLKDKIDLVTKLGKEKHEIHKTTNFTFAEPSGDNVRLVGTMERFMVELNLTPEQNKMMGQILKQEQENNDIISR